MTVVWKEKAGREEGRWVPALRAEGSVGRRPHGVPAVLRFVLRPLGLGKGAKWTMNDVVSCLATHRVLGESVEKRWGRVGERKRQKSRGSSRSGAGPLTTVE